MKTMEYVRVIPRDLFNESKLLKCIGRLCLLIHDNHSLPCAMSFTQDEEGEAFNIGLLEEGSLIITNLQISIKDKNFRRNIKLSTMKTKLPESINNFDEAKKFLRALWLNNEDFHPEDSAFEILWQLPDEQNPTFKECEQLDKLISDIYALEGNKDKYPDLAFDPCQYLLDLDLKTYSIAEVKAIWHESLNENNPSHEDFSYFIERMICDNEEFTQWALKATEPEIIERFIELYYPL